MLLNIQNLIINKKDNRIRIRFLILRAACILIMAFLFVGSSTATASASSGIKIYDYSSKKTSAYTGTLPKITLNGAKIDKAATPGILVDGIAIVSYYDVFYKSDIAAECDYNSAKGTLSISKYGITIDMTIGSKKASVNGKSVTMPVAPLKIKYVDIGKVKILVPSRFVSETLGLCYTWYSDITTIAITKNTIQLSYDNAEKFEYAGIKGKVTIDGKSVSLGSMPSVITNNTAMLRAKKVFADSSIGANYYYDKFNKNITLLKGSNKLVMTVGSKTAYLNDRAVQMDTAPIVVTNHETGASYVMVPGGFTAASLGYDYSWNKTTQTSMITARKVNPAGNNTDNTGSEPELGDTGVYNDPGTVLNEWKGSDALYGTCSNIHELDSGIKSNDYIGLIYSFSRDYSYMKNNSETYMIMASAPFEKITSESSGNQISITADNLSCTDQTYQLYGLTSNFVNTLGIYNNTEDIGTTIELGMLSGNYRYDLSLSSDKMILYITVYKNCVTSATIGVNDAGDYLTLGGNDPLKVNITTQSDLIYLDLPDAINGLGEIYTDISGSQYIRQLYLVTYADKTQIIMRMNPGYEYYIIENGNQYTLSFRAPGAVEEEPETPVIIDKSRYEIVIPKPPEIMKSMISDEDFYFNNYFVIRLQGNFTEFYNSHNINYNSDVINNISFSVSGGVTEIKIDTSKLQGYEIASDNEAIYVHIGNPRDIYKNIVVLDSGHGGSANGAQHFGSKEKDINLKILYTIGKNYFNSDTSKLKVYYTRTTDVDMSLNDRAAFAKKVGADLFISLHMNAVVDAAGVHGSEVFYSNKNNSANSIGLRSQDLAIVLNTNLYTTLGTTDRGVKTANYVVIYKNTVPAVLIELGFMTNANDYALLTNEEFQNNAAKTIYETLLQVFEAYPTGR